MAAAARSPLFCTKHPEEVAQTICIRHNSLLCLTCALEKAKLNDCEVKEMRTLKENRDNILLDLLEARQKVTQQLQEHIKYVEKAQTQKEQFSKTVIDFHSQLIKQFDEKKDRSIAKINEETTTILNFSREQMPKLKELESQIAENIKQLSEQSEEDLSEVNKKLERIKTSLTEVAGITSKPKGHCTPNLVLTQIVGKTDQLAELLIYDNSVYEEYENTSKPENTESGTKSEKQYDKDKPVKPECSASDNYSSVQSVNTTALDENRRTSNIKKHENQTEVNLRQQKKDKSEKPRKGIFSLFGKGKSKQKNESDTKSLQEENVSPLGEEEIYQEAPFISVTSIHPKQLVNKTLTVPELKETFSSACKFSKLVCLGENRIALLSKAHSKVVVVGLDGKVMCKKTFKESTDIARMENDQIAVLNGQSQIVKYRIDTKGFDMVGSFQIKDCNGVLEFDYHHRKAQFAVISSAKITIFDKMGKVVKEEPFNFQDLGDSDAIFTKYDFENDCIYVLNRRFNTFDCYSFQKDEVLWKKRMDVTPNSICLYKENICLTSDNIIFMFSSSSGKPNMHYEVNNLVEKCFGVCAIDDVMIVSSGSDDMEQSIRFGFVRM